MAQTCLTNENRIDRTGLSASVAAAVRETGRLFREALKTRAVFLAILVLITAAWMLRVYLPLRERIAASRANCVQLGNQVDELAGRVDALSSSEKLLQYDNAYLWDQVIHTRLRLLKDGEQRLPDKQPQNN